MKEVRFDEKSVGGGGRLEEIGDGDGVQKNDWNWNKFVFVLGKLKARKELKWVEWILELIR